jgi:hypothetical protein
VRDRFLDKGAIFGGWVGLGMAIVVALAFELIIPVQALVFLMAPLMGAVIGIYANVRAERWRPRRRVLANALYAGAVTGLAVAVFYVGIRLIFIYGDSGSLPDGTSLTCQTGPDCVYQRLVIEEQRTGSAGELEAEGITDAQSLEAFAWRSLALTGAALFLLTLSGAVIGGFVRSVTTQPTSVPLRKPSAPASASTGAEHG